MKYKEIFVSWWFWVLVIINAWVVGSGECIGFSLGVIFVTGIYASIIWIFIWIINKIYTKLKNK